MAVAFRNSSTYNSGASTTSSFSISLPSGSLAGDYIFIGVAFTGGTGVTVTPPAGFTQVITQNSTTALGGRMYRKFVSASDTTYAFTLSGAQNVSAIALAFTGMSTAGAGALFPDATSSSAIGSGTTSPTTGTFAAAYPAYALSVFASVNTSSALTVSSPGGSYTKLDDTSTTASSFVEIAAAGLANTTTGMGLYTAPAATFSGTTTNNIIFTIFLRQNQTQLTIPSIDFTSVSSINSGSTSNIFYSPSQPNERAIAIFYIQGATGSVSSITTSGVTWEKLTSQQNAGNTMRIEVWQARLGTTIQSYTAAVTYNTNVVADYLGFNFVRVEELYNFATANSTTGAASCTITTKTDHSAVFSILAYSANGGAVGPTLYANFAYQAGVGTCDLIVQLDNAINTSVTSPTITSPTTTPWLMVQIEIPSYSGAGNLLSLM